MFWELDSEHCFQSISILEISERERELHCNLTTYCDSKSGRKHEQRQEQ